MIGEFNNDTTPYYLRATLTKDTPGNGLFSNNPLPGEPLKQRTVYMLLLKNRTFSSVVTAEKGKNQPASCSAVA